MNGRLVPSISLLLGALVACGGQGNSGAAGDAGGGAGGGGGGKKSDAGGGGGNSGGGGGGDGSASAPEGGASTDADTTDSPAPASDGGLPPAGWLYTVADDNHVYLSSGSSGTVWMGRGVNMDDVFLCGYNEGFWMANPDGEQALAGMVSDLMTNWKPNFVRVSLSMDSYTPYGISWSADTSQYATYMTSFIEAIGANPDTYVLVTLRSEASMVNAQNAQCAHGGDDSVCIPTSGTDTSFTTALYADLEAKQIPNLAWDLDTYNNCAPDLANVTATTAITPSAWGQVVKSYLGSH